MLRAEVFTKSPGKLSVSWYDFSMAAFDLYTWWDMAVEAMSTNFRRERLRNPRHMDELLKSLQPICEIIMDDNHRYETFLMDHDNEMFLQMLAMSQLIKATAEETKVSLNLEFDDGVNEESWFDNWFSHHGKELDK